VTVLNSTDSTPQTNRSPAANRRTVSVNTERTSSFLFQGKTFVVVCDEDDTIARAKAHMLHILYELGRSDLQFRFKFKGEYLKDSLSLSVIQSSDKLQTRVDFNH
jgi:hypothetical protein